MFLLFGVTVVFFHSDLVDIKITDRLSSELLLIYDTYFVITIKQIDIQSPGL